MRSPRTRIALLSLALLLALAALASAETIGRGNLRVSFDGAITPHTLPRRGTAPIRVAVATKIATADGSDPPRLKQIQIAINSNGIFEPKGLPVCPLRSIQPSTTADALAACKSSLVGEGTFEANVLFTQQSPFPSQGKLYAFNSTIGGKPAILAHVYGVRPAPTSFTLEFLIGHKKGTFGTSLTVKLPKSQSGGYITGISLALGKTFSSHGKKSSYLSATCPAPKGVHVASFPFAKASFAFVGGAKLSQTLNRSCSVRGK